MKRSTWRSAGAMLLASSLVACGGDSGSPIAPDDPSSSAASSMTAPEVPEDPVASPGIRIDPPTSRSLDHYSEFTYQVASSLGLSPGAARRADEVLANLSNPWIDEAVAEDGTKKCLEGESRCGYFSLELEWLPCAAEVLCVKQTIGKAGIGMATGFAAVEAVRIDPQTGQDATLTDVLGAEQAAQFVEVLNESAALIWHAGMSAMDADPPRYNEETIPAWLPMQDGIRVWFPKYAVAPGAEGVVEIRIESTPTGFRAEPSQPRREELIDSYDRAYGFLCSSEPKYLPQVANRCAGAWATSALQTLLKETQIEAGVPIFEGAVTGYYDDVTEEAVVGLQALAGITVDGLVGPETWGVLQMRHCWHEEAPLQDAESVSLDQLPPVELVEVPGVVGMGNKDAEAVLSRWGLRVSMRPQMGDPSLAAQSNNQCIVVDQTPSAGSLVERGVLVNARMECPNTGFAAPVAPQPWSG